MTPEQKELLEHTNEELKKVGDSPKLQLAIISYALNKYLELENKCCQ